MKCRICGAEYADGAEACPECGTRAAAQIIEDNEMIWNSTGFPEPKEVEEIDMTWPEFNVPGKSREKIEDAAEITFAAAEENERPMTFLSGDASEGYFTSYEASELESMEEKGGEEKSAPAEKEAEEAVSAQEAEDAENAENAEQRSDEKDREKKTYEIPNFGVFKMPELSKEKTEDPVWYTQSFTATGVMKTGPAVKNPDGSATIKPEARITNIVVSEPVEMQPEVPLETPCPAMSDTFIRKNEEFQKLLDREYERIRALHKDSSYDPLASERSPKFAGEVKAKSVSDFEKMLMEGTQDSGSVSIENPLRQDPDAEASGSGDFEIFDRIEAASGDIFAGRTSPGLEIGAAAAAAAAALAKEPERKKRSGADNLAAASFDIDTIESTIRELEAQVIVDEAAREERNRKLEAMAAAREAYFRTLDEAEKEAREKERRRFFGRLRVEEIAKEKPAEEEEVRTAAEEEQDYQPIIIEDAPAENSESAERLTPIVYTESGVPKRVDLIDFEPEAELPDPADINEADCAEALQEAELPASAGESENAEDREKAEPLKELPAAPETFERKVPQFIVSPERKAALADNDLADWADLFDLPIGARPSEVPEKRAEEHGEADADADLYPKDAEEPEEDVPAEPKDAEEPEEKAAEEPEDIRDLSDMQAMASIEKEFYSAVINETDLPMSEEDREAISSSEDLSKQYIRARGAGDAASGSAQPETSESAPEDAAKRPKKNILSYFRINGENNEEDFEDEDDYYEYPEAPEDQEENGGSGSPEEGENEEKAAHPILKALLAVLAVALLLELITIALKHFAPDAGLTSTLSLMESAVAEFFSSLGSTVRDGIGVIGK